MLTKTIQSAGRPKSFWIAFALCSLLPLIGLLYMLLLHYGHIEHTILGFLFFLTLILVATCFMAYYFVGMVSGKYRNLKGLRWAELPW